MDVLSLGSHASTQLHTATSLTSVLDILISFLLGLLFVSAFKSYNSLRLSLWSGSLGRRLPIIKLDKTTELK